MRRKVLIASASIAAVALVGCGDDPAADDTTTAAADDATTDASEDQRSDGTSGADAMDADPREEGTLVDLTGADGGEVGIATFTDTDDGVRVEVDASGLAPGFHGFHLHEVAECDPDAADGPFSSAEGHWSIDEADHGDHTGDLPPLLVTEDGTATASFVTDRFTLADVTAHGGVAVMIHAGPDNLANVPDRYTAEGADAPGPDQDTLDAGDAGDRAACGILAGDGQQP